MRMTLCTGAAIAQVSCHDEGIELLVNVEDGGYFSGMRRACRSPPTAQYKRVLEYLSRYGIR